MREDGIDLYISRVLKAAFKLEIMNISDTNTLFDLGHYSPPPCSMSVNLFEEFRGKYGFLMAT